MINILESRDARQREPWLRSQNIDAQRWQTMDDKLARLPIEIDVATIRRRQEPHDIEANVIERDGRIVAGTPLEFDPSCDAGNRRSE